MSKHKIPGSRSPVVVIADYVRSGNSGTAGELAHDILRELDNAGYKIVMKDETELMLERVKGDDKL